MDAFNPIKLFTGSEPSAIQELDIDESVVADTENITVYDITEMTKENFSISCEASGIPVPEVVFIHPRNVMNSCLYFFDKAIISFFSHTELRH